jgi:hypothetical protein
MDKRFLDQMQEFERRNRERNAECAKLSRERWQRFQDESRERQYHQEEIKALEANRPMGVVRTSLSVTFGLWLARWLFGIR